MEKVEITVSLDKERMEALEIFLKMEDTTPKKQMNDALIALYEQKVPEQIRTFIDAKAKASHARHTPKPHTANQPNAETAAAPRRDMQETPEEDGDEQTE